MEHQRIVDYYRENAKNIQPQVAKMVLREDEMERGNKLYGFYLEQKLVGDSGPGIQVRDASREVRFNNVVYNDGLRGVSPDLVKGSNV
jgi:hypothetical protein